MVIGGGSVAERKIKSLVSLGAHVTIVSPDITSVIRKHLGNREVTWIRSEYKKKYLKNIQLIISATNKKKINYMVFRDAREKGIPVNCVDDIDNCSFIVPASIRKGNNIQVAVSTGGGAPAIAAMIKNQLETILESEWDIMADILKRARKKIITFDPFQKKQFWKKIRSIDISKFKNREDELRYQIMTLITSAENKEL
jgi:precorrin-2 dehydrogenase/sirohydrochlorin ferrochelatase